MSGKKNIGLKSILLSVGAGVLLSFGIATAFLVLETVLVLNETISPSASAIVAIMVHIISAYVGCLLAGKRAKEAVTVATTGVLVVSILLHTVLSVLLMDAQLGHVLRVVLPEILGCVLAMLSLAGKGRNRKTRKVMKRYL